jgi:hypothetical protein
MVSVTRRDYHHAARPREGQYLRARPTSVTFARLSLSTTRVPQMETGEAKEGGIFAPLPNHKAGWASNPTPAR